jgi:Tyrosine phosphatase family
MATKTCLLFKVSLVCLSRVVVRLDLLISLGLPNAEIEIYIKLYTEASHFVMASLNDATKVVDLSSPPFVSISGIHNFRDLGGYAVSPTLSVRRNVIYRCGEPSKVTPNGIETLKSLGVTHIYDLRSKVEIDRNKDASLGGIKEWDGCERVFAPVFIDQDYSPENLALRFKDYASEGTEVIL